METHRDEKKQLLRRRAEAIVSRDGTEDHENGNSAALELQIPSNLADPTPEMMTRIIHDLRVYQVELELQNRELRTAYDRLENTEREYRDLFEDAPMGLVIVDRNGMIRKCNATFMALLELDRSPRGVPLADIVSEESARIWRGRFRALFTDPRNKRIDLELATQDRVRRVIRFVGRGMERAPGTVTGSKDDENVLMLVAFDVSDEIAAREQTENLLVEKDLLLRELRHRTQNHLATIQSILSVQANYTNEENVRDALVNAGRRIEALAMVNELLTSRRDQERVELQGYLTELVERIRRSRSGDSAITVYAEVESIVVPPDIGYSLGLIVNELLTNAFKYAFPDGTAGTVYVSLCAEPPDGVALTVTDTGVGIHTAFAAAAGPLPEEHPGAPGSSSLSGGFGLHLVRGLVGQIRGTFTVEGTGSGTRCRIVFNVSR